MLNSASVSSRGATKRVTPSRASWGRGEPRAGAGPLGAAEADLDPVQRNVRQLALEIHEGQYVPLSAQQTQKAQESIPQAEAKGTFLLCKTRTAGWPRVVTLSGLPQTRTCAH